MSASVRVPIPMSAMFNAMERRPCCVLSHHERKKGSTRERKFITFTYILYRTMVCHTNKGDHEEHVCHQGVLGGKQRENKRNVHQPIGPRSRKNNPRITRKKKNESFHPITDKRCPSPTAFSSHAIHSHYIRSTSLGTFGETFVLDPRTH